VGHRGGRIGIPLIEITPRCDTATFAKRLPLLNLRSRFPPNCGAIAQLGERVVRNDEAIGSIPISSTKILHLHCSVSNILLASLVPEVT
jgi:hypothetical protein